MNKEKVKRIYPLGSVITLKDGQKKLMIVGRFQKDNSCGIIYDYSAVLYPEGMLDASELYMFQAEDIEFTYHVGLQDDEEFAFRAFMVDELKKMNMLE